MLTLITDKVWINELSQNDRKHKNTKKTIEKTKHFIY